MKSITSSRNARVKAAIKLRERRGRDKQGRIVVDGLREIGHALAGGVEFIEVFTCEALLESPVARDLLSRLEQSGVERIEVTTQLWEKLTFGNRQDGLLAIATPAEHHLVDLPTGNDLFLVVLDGVEKPGNVGAVVRSADAAGADAVILTEPATDIFNPNAIRASIGTMFRLPVVAVRRAEAITWLLTNHVNTFLTRVGDGTPYTQRGYVDSCAIVFGSEAIGLSAEWSDPSFMNIQLPMHGAADSLNVSAAAAAVLYEVVRQRGG